MNPVNATEIEAAECWCPFARIAETNDEGRIAGVNRDTSKTLSGRDPRCIGSRCMAWRWNALASKREAEQVGYCGLAGKP